MVARAPIHRYETTLSTPWTATMRFRTEAEVRTSLGAAGFSVDTVHGGWGREPVGRGDGELLVIARR